MGPELLLNENRKGKVTFLGSDKSGVVFYAVAVTVIVLGLYASTFYNYLLFHTLIEFTTISIAFTLFILTWHTRRFLTSGLLKALGIGYGLIAVVDLLHALAYKGMGVFPGYGANLPTQLWIAARYLQALLLCVAPIFAGRYIKEQVFFGISFAVVSATTALVLSGNFPDCFIEGKGLTPFKIISEYVICAFLLVALFLFTRKRSAFNARVFALIVISLLCTIGSELAFTSYLSVYGPANMAGHFLKLAAFYLVYRALVVTGFKEPFELIFRDLKQVENALKREREFSRRLLESMADGVVACDAEGILALFNRTAREWHGLDPLRLPPEEWARHYDLFRLDGITPLPTDEIPLARAFHGEVFRNAGMAIRAKGQATRFIAANGSVITDEKGVKLGAVVVMRDITELRRAEEELRRANEELEKRVEKRTSDLERANRDLLAEIAERRRAEEELAKSEARFRRLAENARDLIYRMSLPEGTYEYMSPASTELTGYAPEEFYRNPGLLREFIHPEWRAYIEVEWSKLLRGEMRPTYEFQIVHRSGDVRWVNQRNIMVRDEEGRPVAIEGIVTDITERKRSEEDLCRLNEELRRLNEELEERVKERTTELENKNSELESLNRLFVGRELRMVELKERIRELEERVGEGSR